MSLRTSDLKLSFSKIFYVVVGVIVGVFLLRVALWENRYYDEKEGTPRNVTMEEKKEEEPEIDETEPTEEEVAAWADTLPDNYPAYITLKGIGQIGRQVAPMGVADDGSLDTPYNIYQLGWYEKSGFPGAGSTGVYDGHNGGPYVQGVLKKMPLLCVEGKEEEREVPGDPSQGTKWCDGEGDVLFVERADGEIFDYVVVENETVPLDESDKYMSKAFTTPVHGKESITLITCTGEWSQSQQTYLSRQFVRAVLR